MADYSNESQLRQFAMLTPGEQANEGNADEDRRTLQAELTRATDPNVKAVLQHEYNRRFNGGPGSPPATSMRDGFPELRADAGPAVPAVAKVADDPFAGYDAKYGGGSARSAAPSASQDDEFAAYDAKYGMAAAAAPASGQFVQGFKRAFAEVPGLAAGSGAYLADVVGADDTRDKLLKYAKDRADVVQADHANDAGSISDAWDGKVPWGDFVANAAGYVAGQALQSLATGGVGALGAKMLATQGIKQVAERTAAEFIAKGATQEVATKAAADAAAKYASQAAVRGGVAGAGAQNVNMELGSIYPDAVDQATAEGRTLDGGDKFRVGASALGAAAVDTAAEAVTASRIFRGSKVGAAEAAVGKEAPKLFGSELAARAAREVPAGALREAGTEAIQTGIEHYGAGQPIADKKGLRDIIDSAGVGAVGGILGGGAASLHARETKAAESPAAAPERGAAPLEMDETASTATTPAPAPMSASPGAAESRDGIPFTTDPRFANAPVFQNGSAPPAQVFGTLQAANIAIGQQGLMGSHEAVARQGSGGGFVIQPKGADGITMISPGVYQSPSDGKSAGDVIREDLQPGTGPATNALNAGIEDAAKKADAAEAADPTANVPHPPRPATAEQIAAIRALAPDQQEGALKLVALGNDAGVKPGVRRYAQYRLDKMLGDMQPLNPEKLDAKTGEPVPEPVPTVSPPKAGNEADQTLARQESLLRASEADAAAQRERDRPPIPTGEPQDGDILNLQNQPFTTMPGARRALAAAGDGHQLVRVRDGLVVRKTQPEPTNGLDASAGSGSDQGVSAPVPAAPVGAGPVVSGEPASGQGDRPVAEPVAGAAGPDRVDGVGAGGDAALTNEHVAGIKSGLSHIDADTRDLWAFHLESKLARKGMLTWQDIPPEMNAAMDTVAFGALKDAIAKNPQAAIDAVRVSSGEATAAAETTNVFGEHIADGWHAFTPESGTKGVPRADMPQIKAVHRGAMVNFLAARGITHETVELPAGSIKPTQTEFSPEKVEKARKFSDTDRSILISSDGHVLDGHHQWLAKLADDAPIKAIRLDALIDQLLPVVREFPSATVADGATASTPTHEQDAQAGANPAAQAASQAPDAAAQRGAAGADAAQEPAGLPAAGSAAVEPDGVAAQWTRMPTAERNAAVVAAGWKHSTEDKPNIVGQRLARTAWDKMPGNVQAKIAAAIGPRAPAEPEVEPAITRAKEARTAPAHPKPKRSTAAQRAADAIEAKRADYFTPGNIVSGYGGFDEVLSYNPPTAGDYHWSVKVQHVKKVDDKWARIGKPQDARVHSTQPGERELKAGPVARLGSAPAASIEYTEPRKDGKDFPNAEARGVVEAPAAVAAPVEPVQADESKPAAAIEPSGKIQDFGAELAGAKKMLYAARYADAMKEALTLKTAEHPLSKTWPAPDYSELLAAGTDPWIAGFVHAARDEIPNKPSASWKLKGWAQNVELLRDVTTRMLDGSISRDAVQTALAKFRGLADVRARGELYEAVGHATSLKGVRLQSGTYSVRDGKTYNPPIELWAVNQQSKGSSFGNWGRDLGMGATKEAAIADFKAKMAEQGADTTEARIVKFGIFSDRKGDIFIGKKVGKETARLKDGFKDVKTARQYLADNQAELEKALADYKDVPNERKESNDPRVGADHRSGADVTPQQFSDAFGFRGVQFGNYVEGARRQADLNNAYDALMDMAGIIGVPARSLSLDGKLGLAFGARGSGKAMAHYEPGNVVINLTKTSGAGSLAHEWWHALDNYFAKTGNVKDAKGSYMTEGATRANDQVRDEMKREFDAIGLAVRQSDMASRARKLDARRGKPYWGTGRELTARSFESYIIAKLNDQSASNDYLANIVPEEAWRIQGTYPYPVGADIPKVRAAFDSFFHTVETKAGDNGNVAMFSRSAGSPEAHALKALSENDHLFQLPRSSADTLEGIAADIDPRIAVHKRSTTGARTNYDLTMPDGEVARLMVRKPNPHGPDIYGYNLVDGEMTDPVTERPGSNPEDVPPTDDVWIDVSQLKGTGDGTKVYAIAANFAHNTGRIFIGDPAGLSDDAMRRRSEQMLSSALKFGTTDHLAPHPRQVQGHPEGGVPALQWTYGDSLANIRSLIDANLAALENAGSDFIDFDPTSGQFLDSEAQPIPRAGVAAAAALPAARGARAGDSTLARGSILRALLREESGAAGSGDGRSDGLLARVLRLGAVHPQATRGIFYSRSGVDPAQARADRAAKVQALVEKITESWKNAPEVIVVRSLDDEGVPEAVRKYDEGQRSDGAEGEIEGFFYKGKVYLIADKLGGDADVLRVLMHESLGHFGLRGVFGQQLGTILDRMAVLQGGKVRDKARKYGLDFEKQSERRKAAEEVLAEMAQTNPELGWVQQAIAAIRTWIRENIPGAHAMKLSDAEVIRSYIIPAREFVKAGEVTVQRSAAPARAAPMFSRTLGATLGEAMNNVNQESARNLFLDATTGHGKVNLWERTVGTQYHKAQKNPETFGKVFNSVQDYIKDISVFANSAADKAPTILPKLDTVRDLKKGGVFRHGADPKDMKAAGAAIFQGTLTYGRDESGRLAQVDDIVKSAEAMTSEQKGKALLRAGKVSEQQLKNWLASPLDIYDGAVRNRYEQAFLRPGVVFTPAELKSVFKLNDQQIGLYNEFRAAVDQSLEDMGKAEMIRLAGKDGAAIADDVRAAATTADAAAVVLEHFNKLGEANPDAKQALDDTYNLIADKSVQIDKLKAEGYAPLMRFGKHTLHVTKGGKTEFFGMYESRIAANQATRQMKGDAEFAGADFQQGLMSAEAHKLFSGLPLDSLELFAKVTDSEDNPAYQDFLKLTKSNRSALKRMIHRQGIAGFSEDASRVLASFVTSNARAAAGSLNLGRAKEAAESIPKENGDLKDEAVKLIDYVQNPQEEAPMLRGLLFTNFIGGSVASALGNLTQPVTMTLPYLSQFGGVVKAAGHLLAAAKAAAGGKVEGELGDALKRAEKDGIVSPQEIHHLQTEAMSRLGNHPVLKKAAFIWGSMFSLSEQFNRRVSFIAAYNLALQQHIADPFAFAEKAVIETQGLYNKGNKANLARGPIGATAMTFKQFSTHYLEFLTRMYQSGPEGKKAVAVALAILLLTAGAGGLPFADDLDDLLDTLGQAMGYDFNSKRAKRNFIANTLGLGDGMAEFATRGVSGISGVPIDVSLRLGMGNLLPGTGLLLRSNTDRSRDILEFAGAAGGLAKNAMDAGANLLKGDIGGAGASIAPVALQNVAKAAQMWSTGEYRDSKNNKVRDVDGVDAAVKLLGFQPAEVARESAQIGESMRSKQLAINVESEIAGKWAQGVADKDADAIAAARDELKSWNENNPETPIRIGMPQILQRVRKMRESRAERTIKTAPRELRGMMREALN